MNDKHEAELKTDPKAEALIKSVIDLRPDIKEGDVRFIFNLGAVYGAARVAEKAKEAVLASWTTRLKRKSGGGEA